VTKNYKILIAVAVTVAATAAFWFLALAPKREEAAGLATKIEAKQVELTAAQATLGSYEKARENYSANYATVVRLGKAVPEDDDLRSLMVQLDAAAGSTGVDFRTIQVGGEGGAAASSAAPTGTAGSPPPGAVSVGTAGFSAMPFSFSFRGSFTNLSQFFSHMERFVTLRNERMNVTGRLLRLESIDLQVDQSGFPQIRAQIGASSYLVPPTQGLTAGATPQGPAATTPAAGATPAPGGGPAVPTTPATVTGATR
jgi:Tfp pilus assembly protein PilO